MNSFAKIYRSFGLFAKNCDAAAAVEFALLFSLLASLLAGSFEYSRAIQTGRRLTEVTNSIAVILASTPPAGAIAGATPVNGVIPSTTGTLNYVILRYAHDATMVLFPSVLADASSQGNAWGANISISMAGVRFAPTIAGCVNGCTYVASVTWTGDAQTRACKSLQNPAPNTDAPTPNTLPQDLFKAVATQKSNVNLPPTPVIVVDVAYTWRPIAFSRLIGPITMRRSAYMNARYMNELTYQLLPNDNFGTLC